MLFIDEADALLGRRTELRDSHDRYANIEIAFLLECLEAFDGLAIVSAGMRDAASPSRRGAPGSWC